MRFYNIVITDKNGNVQVPNAQAGAFTATPASANASTWTSFVNGQTLPGALNIELDIPIAGYAEPQGNAWLRVWGIPLVQIAQSANLNNMNIAIYAGMQKGLPLAKPQQAGLIIQGQIFQSFGNWRGVDMTLDFVLYPSGGTLTAPKNIVLNWKAGTPLSQALNATLQIAFPGFKIVIAVSPNLVLAHDEVSFHGTLSQFAQFLNGITRPIVGGTYPGVDIAVYGNTITAFDLTQPFGNTTLSKPNQIAFEDMIGQPTWIGPQQINLQLVMRHDINVGDYIKLPPGIASPYALTTVAAAVPNTPARNKTSFSGVFNVMDVHHFGNFRQADATSWNTTVNAAYVPSPPTTGAPSSGTGGLY